jgi:hypothetical protein
MIDRDDEIDEDPDDADIERLDHESAYCPDCGTEVWDDAEICPRCRSYIGGNASHKRPEEGGLTRRWKQALVVVLIIVAMLVIWFRSRPAGF